MPVPDHFWHQLGNAEPAEQQALDALRRMLPDDPRTRAWCNVMFRTRAGRRYEVDVILVHRNGMYVLEFKGWHGRITGNQSQWRITSPNGRVRTEPDPSLANEKKAKAFKGELTSALQRRGLHLPHIRAITVMHGHDSVLELDERAVQGVYGLDGYRVRGVPPLSELLDAAPSRDDDIINQQRAQAITVLIEELGLIATPLSRLVGGYALDDADPVGEGRGWVDRRAKHPSLKEYRRIRVYDMPPAATAQERRAIEQTARREHMLVQRLDHRGVVKPLDYIAPPDGAPALVFPDDRADAPLLEHLAEQSLDARSRLALIRAIGEVIAYAHDHGVQHRALTPLAVRIRRSDGRVLIRDWQSGSGEAGETASTTIFDGVSIPADLVASDGLLYLAPESHRPDPDPVALDVFGLGALAYLILTDAPPADNLGRLQERLQQGGLDPAADRDGLPPQQCDAVRAATEPDVQRRTPTVEAFLAQLQPAPEEDKERIADPRDAQPDSIIADRWIVKARIGEGGSGIALLVDDGDLGADDLVLKVAADHGSSDRIRAEGEVLARLQHPRIVTLHEGPLDVGGHAALLLADAGRPTLEQRITAEGRLTLEQLERYGADLFEAVGYLESQGVFHRDIKPANLGVGGRTPHLVLFDFSLATEPLEKTGSGTPGYLDPFLGHGSRRQYDSAAERFAVAATLFRMATTELPVWGDGQSNPALIADEVHLSPGQFEPEIADAAIAFFRRALARSTADRFDDISSMAQAWRAVFPATGATGDGDASEAERNLLAERARRDTPLREAGLTSRAVSAARRLDAEQVADLLAAHPARINNLAGVGWQVRRELQTRRRQWEARLGASATSTAEEEAALLLRRVETVQAALVPKPRSRAAAAIPFARRLLNIDVPEGASPWPDHATAAAESGSPGDPLDLLSALSTHWARRGPLSEVAAEVRDALTVLGGTATVGELAERLVALRGSAAEGYTRRMHAVGLIRAVVEADAGAEFALLRHGDQVIITTADEDADRRLDAAATLADAIDDALTGVDGVLGPNAGTGLHRSFATDLGIADPRRGLALAARASRTGALSSRDELYPRGMAAAQALRAVLSSTTSSISAERLRAVTVQRFPSAAPLPPRPALDDMVTAANGTLSWNDAAKAYTRASESASLVSTMTRYTVPMLYDSTREALTASLAARSAAVLTARPHQVHQTPALLTEQYGVHVVDVAARLVNAMRDTASSAGVDWSLVLRADAAPPDSGDRANLTRLVADAVDRFWPDLLADPRPLLLIDAAPLARYGQVGRIATMLDLATPRPAARWLLVPMRAGATAPTLNGEAIPIASSTWVELPESLRVSA